MRGLGSLLVLAAGASLAGAADLTKIDRKIAKEPSYARGEVRYCLAVMGPKAERRLWIVADEKNLYVDVNGNGDLTEPDERFKVSRDRVRQDVSLEKGKTLRIELDSGDFFLAYSGKETATQYADPQPASTASDAPIVHFAGPLTLKLDDEELQIPAEPSKDDGPELYVVIGTPGLGKGTFASIRYSDVPADVHPAAEIELPGKDPSAKPTNQRISLNGRC